MYDPFEAIKRKHDNRQYIHPDDIGWLLYQVGLLERIKVLVEDENLTKGESFDKIARLVSK